MLGIKSYAGYIPRYRLNRMTIFSSMGWLNPAIIMNAAGEKSVANYDEDSVTMAAAAGQRCLEGIGPAQVGALYYASTTSPFRERSAANIVSAALGIEENVRSADFGSSAKAGTTALISAIEFCAANPDLSALAAAADCRIGKVGSVQEMVFGDAGAAVMVGSDDVIAEFDGSYSVSCDFVDHLRGSESRYDRQWEERWIRDLGYERIIPEAVQAYLDKYGSRIEDYTKIIYPCYYGAARKNINRKLGLNPAQLQDDLMMECGDSGSAHPLLLLAGALENASSGDKLMVIGFGYGCDILGFTVTEAIAHYKDRLRVSDSIKREAELDSFTKYLAWRDMLPVEVGLRGEEDKITRWSMVWRNRGAILGLKGTVCLACGTRQYPPQRICVNPDCGAIDQMEPFRFADQGGNVVSFTSDMLAATINPPAIYGNIDFNGGGRCMMDFTDCAMEDLEVGKAVKFTFRVKYYDRRRDTTFYFWKAVPAEEVPVNG